MLTQGLRPGLCRSIALTGLFYVLINYWFVLIRLSSRLPNEMLAYLRALVCGLCMMDILINICLRMRSCAIYSATASAVGTILLHSPGCNEGKARNETLGTHRQK